MHRAEDSPSLPLTPTFTNNSSSFLLLTFINEGISTHADVVWGRGGVIITAYTTNKKIFICASASCSLRRLFQAFYVLWVYIENEY